MTDTFLVDSNGEWALGKSLSSLEDESISYMESVKDAAGGWSLDSGEVHRRGESALYTGTAGANALTTGEGLRAGLLVSIGQRDTPVLDRGLTWLDHHPYDLWKYQLHAHPRPLVEPENVKPINERVAAGSYLPPGVHYEAGTVVIPLDEAGVRTAVAGVDIGRYHQPGSNGLTFSPHGLLTICQHGNRRVILVNPHGDVTVLADSYDGARLNSPNDLVYRSDGTVYFTDPPFGLPGVFDDPDKELPFSGVFSVRDGEVSLVTDELEGPNGIAFSPDERHLYVGNWEPERKVVMRYEVGPSGQPTGPGEVLCDLTDAPGEDAIDGIKVDHAGNLYVCGPGGVWIISPQGERLGLLELPEEPHNLAWGGDDGRDLYVTALTSVYRARLEIPGIRP